MGTITEFDHKGKHIIQVAFPAETTLEGLNAVFKEAQAAYAKYPQGGILGLMVFNGIEADEIMLNMLETVAKSNVSKVKATAFIGVHGAQKALFNAMIGVSGREGKIFDSPEEAKDWLVSVESSDDILAGL